MGISSSHVIVEMVSLALARLVRTPVNGPGGFCRTCGNSACRSTFKLSSSFSGTSISKQQDGAVYDTRFLTESGVPPRAWHDWRFVLLVLIGSSVPGRKLDHLGA